MKITVVGIGYVGLSNAILLSQCNEVTALDVDDAKVEMINSKRSPTVDSEMQRYLSQKSLSLTATTNKVSAYKNADYVIISVPTNYDSKAEYFDTSAVDTVIADVIDINPHAIMVIKSTVPVGYTQSALRRFKTDNIIFSPEFLREGQALHDNLYPSRIIVGGFPNARRILHGYWRMALSKKMSPSY